MRISSKQICPDRVGFLRRPAKMFRLCRVLGQSDVTLGSNVPRPRVTATLNLGQFSHEGDMRGTGPRNTSFGDAPCT